MWFIVICSLKHFFFSMSSEFAKVFERKVWRVQVAHLHNAARALSSPSCCGHQIMTKISFVIFDIVQKTNRMRFSVALVKFHWFGINWHVFNQSEYRHCCLNILIIREIKHDVTSNDKRQKWNFCRPFSAVCTINWKYFHLRWIVGYICLFLCGLFKDYKKRINNQR